MAGRVALGVSVIALAVAVLALVVATQDTVETASSAVSDVSELVESLETIAVDPLAVSESVTVLTMPVPGPESTEAADAPGVGLPPDDPTLGTGASDLESPQDAGPNGEPADSAPSVATSLPGEPFEFGPVEGASLAVVGVGHDDVLNVRHVPAGEIIGTLGPLESGIIAAGRSRKLPTTVWHEVRVGASKGWVSDAYVAVLGATFNATTEVVNLLGETPAAGTMPELGRVVAEAIATDEPPSRITVSAPTTIEDLGEITMDVVDVADDSVRGFRVHVFAHLGAGFEPFVLKSVEQTLLCHSHRGVNGDGLCN